MGRGAVLAGCLAVAMLACLGGTTATRHVVGGTSRGWTAPPNITAGYYDEWAAGRTFSGGDSLLFDWHGTHDVTQVSKEEYDNCTKVTPMFLGDIILILTFPADANGPYYFISTMGSDCKNGQKLAINVVSLTPAKSPDSSASSIAAGALSVLALVSSSVIAMFVK